MRRARQTLHRRDAKTQRKTQRKPLHCATNSTAASRYRRLRVCVLCIALRTRSPQVGTAGFAFVFSAFPLLLCVSAVKGFVDIKTRCASKSAASRVLHSV